MAGSKPLQAHLAACRTVAVCCQLPDVSCWQTACRVRVSRARSATRRACRRYPRRAAPVADVAAARRLPRLLSHEQDRQRPDLERLHEWGVRRVFGYPGDGINGIMGALRPRERRACEFVQARHEEMAAFMACGHAKFTGEVGVCLATSGPGAIHLLNGLYDAKAGPPAGGGHRRPAGARRAGRRLPAGGRPAQRCSRTWRTSTCRWRRRRRRCATWSTAPCASRATSARVTCIILPNDLQELDAVETPPREHGTVHTGIGMHARRAWCPTRPTCGARPTCSTPASKVAMLVGAGALHATDEVHRGRRAARRRRRQGAARQGRGAGRPALRHRLHRPARHQAELGADGAAATRC